MVSSGHSYTEHPVVIKGEEKFWKRILIVDDNKDITTISLQLSKWR
jgi:hypothetical protein